MMRLLFPIVFFGLTFIACQKHNEGLLIGHWQAIELKEAEAPVEVDLSAVHLQFQENDRYQYRSTLNYREAGTYFLEGKYLYTTDTLNRASSEKVVEILQLSSDSLHLKMKEGETYRWLKMTKVQE